MLQRVSGHLPRRRPFNPVKVFYLYFWLGPKVPKTQGQAELLRTCWPSPRLPLCNHVLFYFLFPGVMLLFKNFTSVSLRQIALFPQTLNFRFGQLINFAMLFKAFLSIVTFSVPFDCCFYLA